MASTRARVESTRLSSISFLYAGVQRLAATLAPARLTTASAPSTLHGPLPKRGSATAASPRSRSAAVSAPPISPLAPATITRMCGSMRDRSGRFLRYCPRRERALLDQPPGPEFGGVAGFLARRHRPAGEVVYVRRRGEAAAASLSPCTPDRRLP